MLKNLSVCLNKIIFAWSFIFCFIHINPDLTKCCAGLCDLVAGSQSDEVWIKIDAIPYPISSRLCSSVLHKRAPFRLVFFKQRTNLLSSTSLFKNQISLVTLFMHELLVYHMQNISLDLIHKFLKNARSRFPKFSISIIDLV